MPVRRLNHAVLYVRDLAATVPFYRETLGFEVRMEIPGRAAFLRAPGSANDHDLGLFEVADGAAPDGQYLGLYHLAWEVGTLAGVAGMVPGAGEAIFAVARTAGWIAHAMEEYDRNAPIRPRGIYTGPVAES